jgi:hypothetical protein
MSGLPMPKVTPPGLPAGQALSGGALGWRSRLVGRRRTAVAVGAGCLFLSLVAFAVTRRHGSHAPTTTGDVAAIPAAPVAPAPVVGPGPIPGPGDGTAGLPPGVAGAPALTATAANVKGGGEDPDLEDKGDEKAREIASQKLDDKAEDSGEEPSSPGTSSRASARAARAKALAEGRKMLDEGERLLRAQHFSEARDVFTKLTKVKPVRGSALVGLAEISFQEKKYDEAVRSAKLAAKGGGGVRARVLLGDAHFRLSQYKEAADAYEQALKIEPTNPSAKSGLALASKRM